MLAQGRVPVAAALLVLPVLAAVVNWPARDRSDFTIAKDYVDNTLRGMEKNALLITDDWQLFAPMIYFNEVEKVRPDVIPIEYGMLIRSWYIRQLERRYPDFMALVKKELDAYKPLLETSENDPQMWADPVVQDDFNKRLDDLVFAMIEKQTARGGHAYATYEVALSQDAVDVNLVRRLQASFDAVPRGIALELMPGHAARDVQPAPLELRGLITSDDDVVRGEVLPAYRTVALLRARHLGLARKYDAALAEYQTALALDPTNTMIEREIQAMRVASGK